MPKITESCHDELHKLSKTKKGANKFFKRKVEKFCEICIKDESYLNTQPVIARVGTISAHKLKITTLWGAYRLIVVGNILIDFTLIDFFAKADKLDLNNDEMKEMRKLMVRINNGEEPTDIKPFI
jgi:hypothetical protein